MVRFGYSKSRPPGGDQARRARFYMQVLGKKFAVPSGVLDPKHLDLSTSYLAT